MTDLTPDLQFLVGQPVSGVYFVVDYVELHFDGSYLRCLADPTVQRDGVGVTFPSAGSRDALCSLIGSEVRSIRGAVEGELSVRFSDGAALTTSLRSDEGLEVLHFHDRLTGETQWW